MKLLGAVIAGGQSTRMKGQDKLAAPWESGTLLGHITSRLHAQVQDVVVNIPEEKQGLLSNKLRRIAPDRPGRSAGPLAGLEAAMIYGSDHGFTHIVTTAGDTPFFPTDLVDRLMESHGEVRILRTGQYPQPLFGMWPVGLRSSLSSFIDAAETFKVMAFAKKHDLSMVELPASAADDAFFNVNTPADLDEAHARWRQRHMTHV
ncbi:MAG: molybdenum cofactor guanylyltransferase [Pseudomonadota bacterium]